MLAGFFMRAPMGQCILITGGTRSGKSQFAVTLAKGFGRRIVYVATGAATDHEMRRRIARHRHERPRHWRTMEHPADPARAITQLRGAAEGAIVDCLTMYISGLMLQGHTDASLGRKVAQLCAAIRRASYPVILVTNEVGCGIVPDYPLGRRFRDLAGRMNQMAAAHADAVYLMVAGLPLLMKGRADARTESTRAR